jgi:hypothetical protein
MKVAWLMKSAVLLMSLLLAAGFVEVRSAGFMTDGAASQSLIRNGSPSVAGARGDHDTYYAIYENELLTFNWIYKGPYNPGDELGIATTALPQNASMPPVYGATPTLNTQFSWAPTYCQSSMIQYIFDILSYNYQVQSDPIWVETIHITVNNVNRSPFFESPAFTSQRQINAFADTIPFHGSLQLYPTAHDSDCTQCGDDTLYMSYTADPPSASIVFADLGLGVSSFLWTPTSADSGWHTVTFTATDAHDTSATQVWNILVRVNHAPTITSTVPSQLQLRAGQNYHLNLTAFDYDLQQFGDDTLKMSYSTSPSSIFASFANNGGGSATFDWTPLANERGNHTITFKVTDFFGLTDTKQTLAQVYVCGDANSDATVDISDAVYLIAYIFSGGSAPSPLLAGDANCDSTVDISDAVYLISYIFSGGPAPCAACK